MRSELCHHCGATVESGATTCASCGNTVFTQRFLGQILVDEGIVDTGKLEKAIQLQKRRLGEILVDIGACSESDLDRALQIQKVGRSRLHSTLRYLKLTIGLLALTVLGLCIALVRIERNKSFLHRLQEEKLSVQEVRSVMAGDSSHSKFEALRSLRHHLDQPEAIQLIAHALRHEAWYVKLYAVVLARQSRDAQLVPDLLKIMKDDPEFVAPFAHDAVREITEAQLERLKELDSTRQILDEMDSDAQGDDGLLILPVQGPELPPDHPAADGEPDAGSDE